MRYENAFDPHTAYRIYIENPNGLGNKELRELYDIVDTQAIARIKAQARELMRKTNRFVAAPNKVNTECVFELAGLTREILEQQCAQIDALHESAPAESAMQA